MGKPSAVGQPTRPIQPFILPGSSNPCKSELRRQTAEHVVRGVVYRPRDRVHMLAAVSRPT